MPRVFQDRSIWAAVDKAIVGCSRWEMLPGLSVVARAFGLRELGYVEQAEKRGTYSLSDRLRSLREYGRDEALREKALPIMQAIHKQFDETVNLGVFEGRLYIRYAHVLETTQALRWIVRPGARDAFHTTALGRAIAARQSAAQIERLIPKAVAMQPASQRKSFRERLVTELDVTKSRGWALEEEETVPGVACVAVSLAGLGEPLAAISVSAPIMRFPKARRDELIESLIDAVNTAAKKSRGNGGK